MRFLYIALGSASELEYHMQLSRDLKYLPITEFEELTQGVSEVKRMLGGLIKRLKADS